MGLGSRIEGLAAMIFAILGTSVLVNVDALIIRIGFGGALCYSYSKGPPQKSIGNCLGSYISLRVWARSSGVLEYDSSRFFQSWDS